MKIRMNGPIIDDSESWIYRIFGIDAVYPKSINQQIEKAEREGKQELTVLINSGGGSVFAASEIYTALKSFKGKVHTQIVGIAASAASFIANAGECSISPTGQIMVHNASMANRGDYRSMDKSSDILRNVNASIRNAYKAKTGKSDEEIIKLMEDETWMTAQQALELGFVDKIMFEDDASTLGITASNESGALPRNVVDKMQDLLAEGKIKPSNSTGAPDDEKQTLEALLSSGDITLEDIQNVLNGSSAISNQKNNQPEQGDEKMDIEKIKNDHPELYKSIKEEGYEEGVTAERERIQSIEDLSYPGVEDLVNKAKFENSVTAPELAMQIVKAEKAMGTKFLNDRNADAQNAGTVPPGSIDEADKKQKSAENASALAAAMGGSRK
ncbi:head maturation protease, ClpP-related [Sporosarcina sp. P33]|uniref:head maturation protease, ClpP-related n=1 Tax=Sporosarcina sp. P33 TaxID=1930764 RepID=UPI0009C063F9|nr:head maturation protease, ClpP-related [Sporosarcina sp. P33]ARD47582.1 hypothetical protein SporoP33_04570 [Sporosarcina sp. P33]